MARLIGNLVGVTLGGWLFIYLAAALIEFLIVQRVADNPVNGKVGSAVGGYVVIASLGAWPRGHFDPWIFVVLLPAFLIVLYFGHRRGRQIARDMAEDTGRSYY